MDIVCGLVARGRPILDWIQTAKRAHNKSVADVFRVRDLPFFLLPRYPNMNLIPRITTYCQMLAHFMEELRLGEFHVHRRKVRLPALRDVRVLEGRI